jgi:hypothetical protein
MVLIRDGVIFSLLFMIKIYLYLTKSADLVIRNNCTVLCFDVTSHSLPSEQVAVENNVSERAENLMASDARTI